MRELGKKIDKMIEDSEFSKIEWKQEVDQRVEEVRKNIDTLENKTREVLGDKEKWKEVEDRVRKATEDLMDAVESAFKPKEGSK